MAFERRMGAFMLQKSQQIIVMVLYCPKKECAKPMINKEQLEEHLHDVHDLKRYRCLYPNCDASYDE